MGGAGYYRKLLRLLSKRTRPIKLPSPGVVKFELAPVMKVIVREILAKSTTLGLPRLGCRRRELPTIRRLLRRLHRQLWCRASLISAALP